jgi:hypothetical protein
MHVPSNDSRGKGQPLAIEIMRDAGLMLEAIYPTDGAGVFFSTRDA